MQDRSRNKYAKKYLSSDNSGSVLNTVLSTINKACQYAWFDEVVMVLNAHPICQSVDDGVPGQNYSIPGLGGTMFLEHQVWPIRFIVRRWVRYCDMSGVLGQMK
jgi:hypothetical protein